jgi:replicative DNA helicase
MTGGDHRPCRQRRPSFHAIPVAATLGKDLTKAGGAPYLHTLVSVVPTVANAGYYAQLVRDHAYARRVIETGSRLTHLEYDAPAQGATADLRAAVAIELAAITANDTHGWPDPTPLTATTTGLPTFLLWTLPDWIGTSSSGTPNRLRLTLDAYLP